MIDGRGAPADNDGRRAFREGAPKNGVASVGAGMATPGIEVSVANIEAVDDWSTEDAAGSVRSSRGYSKGEGGFDIGGEGYDASLRPVGSRDGLTLRFRLPKVMR